MEELASLEHVGNAFRDVYENFLWLTKQMDILTNNRKKCVREMMAAYKTGKEGERETIHLSDEFEKITKPMDILENARKKCINKMLALKKEYERKANICKESKIATKET